MTHDVSFMESGGARAGRTPGAVRWRVRRGAGFTMMELLTVIGLIILLAALVLPILGGMVHGSRREAGFNSVNVALAAARTAATQTKVSMDPPATGASF